MITVKVHLDSEFLKVGYLFNFFHVLYFSFEVGRGDVAFTFYHRPF